MRLESEPLDRPAPAVPTPPTLSASYEDWLSYLRKLERAEPYDHPTLQVARRAARGIVRQKLGVGPKLMSNSFKTFSFDRCKRDLGNGDPM